MVGGGRPAPPERQLKMFQVPYRSVHVHPLRSRAGYYPGTSMLHLKVLFDPTTGRILGAQATGFDGVDKRLDVLAAAIRNGSTVFDLEEYETRLRPRRSASAKDPINMVGFVASNTRSGATLKLWYARGLPGQHRGARGSSTSAPPEEYGIWHIPGAENVPLGTLRKACAEWDPTTPLRVYCAVGFRSYLAQRALVQRGFEDVATLSGGSTTFRFWHDLEDADHGSPAPVESYAERESLKAPERPATGVRIDLDCAGLACPGPILKLTEKMGTLEAGDEILVNVSDPGFGTDAPAWAKRNGHQLLELTPSGPGYTALFRKGRAGQLSGEAAAAAPAGKAKTSFVVFSGDLDKLIAAFIIANGALAMGEDVSMFFTFWGLNSLRDKNAPAREKSMMDKMFATMMPAGADSLTLSEDEHVRRGYGDDQQGDGVQRGGLPSRDDRHRPRRRSPPDRLHDDHGPARHRRVRSGGGRRVRWRGHLPR